MTTVRVVSRRILVRYGLFQGGNYQGTVFFKENITKVRVVSKRILPRYGLLQGGYYQGTGCYKKDIIKVRVRVLSNIFLSMNPPAV